MQCDGGRCGPPFGYFLQVSWCSPFSNTVLDSSLSALGGARQLVVCTVRFLVLFQASSLAHGIINLHGVPTALRSLESALRRWGRYLLGWPSGSSSAGVLVELDLKSFALVNGPHRFDAQWSSSSYRLPRCLLDAWNMGPPRVGVVFFSQRTSHQHVWVVPGSPPSRSQHWFGSEIRPCP